MIESNGVLGTLMSQSHAQGRSHLTDKQSQLVTDTLSKYDPNNLTEADAKEITSSFREAEIRPSKALKEAISAEGFDLSVEALRRLNSDVPELNLTVSEPTAEEIAAETVDTSN